MTQSDQPRVGEEKTMPINLWCCSGCPKMSPLSGDFRRVGGKRLCAQCYPAAKAAKDADAKTRRALKARSET